LFLLSSDLGGQKVELYRRFFPETPEFEAREFVNVHRSAATMAEFQGLLLELERKPVEFVNPKLRNREGAGQKQSAFGQLVCAKDSSVGSE
jgi:hypothetical protein